MKGRITLLLAITSFILVQCSNYKYTRFHGATKMAKVMIPDTIHTMAIINRTKAENILQTGGGLGNKPGVDQTLSSFRTEVGRRNFFNISALNKTVRAEQNADFPSAFIKEELQSMYSSDLIVASLEVFQVQEYNEFINDTKMQLDPQGKEYYITIVRGIKTLKSRSGWRLYNTADGSVLDEFILDHDHKFEVEGIDRANANLKMEERIGQAYSDLGAVLGFMYAERVSPVSAYVTRKYYSKSRSCPELKQALDFIKLKDWETAKTIWMDGIQSNINPKDIAKLYYNLGVYYECQGNLNMAIEQLQKSYENDVEIARAYLNELKNIERNGYPLPVPAL